MSEVCAGEHLLENQQIIVTGGAQGIGLGIARVCAEHGARIFLLDQQGEKAQAAAAGLPGRAAHQGVACDVTNPADRRRAIEQVRQSSDGRIDVLVNNAGITHVQRAEEMDEKRWRDVIEVNLNAVMFMSRDVAPVMLEQRSGSIINIGSITSLVAFPGRAVYVASKTAILGLTRTLAVEWARHGVRVNAIGPGYHCTPLFEKYASRGLIDPGRIRRRIPAGRLGTVDDVGRAAVFFASRLSEYVTGQLLMVDGGYTAFGAAEDASP